MTPTFKIVAASDAYLWATMTKRGDVLGRGIFEVFPDNPDDPDATGVRNLTASLNRVVNDGVADVMAIQEHDIRRPEAEGGGFEERYWSPTNAPVKGTNGNVAYIIHRIEEVTQQILTTRYHQERQVPLERQVQERTVDLQTNEQRFRELAEACVPCIRR